MTNIAVGSRNELAPQMMSSMHEFRHEVFVSRLGWSLPLIEGTERDQYDGEDAVYLMACDEDDRVTACARLLPTVGAYMLPDLFPQLLGRAQAPRDPAIWELSRFATSMGTTGAGRVLSLSKSTLALLDSVFSFARQQGIERFALVTSIAIERLMLRAGLEVHRIAPPAQVNGALCVALFMEVSGTNEPETNVALH